MTRGVFFATFLYTYRQKVRKDYNVSAIIN